jgi:hypothetical protein
MTEQSFVAGRSTLGRGLVYAALIGTLWLVGKAAFDLVHHVADTFPFQHERTLLNSLVILCLWLVMLSGRASVRRWLMVLSAAMVVASAVLSITTP